MREDGSLEGGSRRGGRGLLPVVAGLVAGLVLGGAVGGYALGPLVVKRLSEPAGGAVEARERGAIHVMEGLVVNPADSQGLRFLVATVAFEVDSPATAEELAARDAEVRDAVLGVLGSKTVAQLADVGGREALKEELRAVAAGMVEKGEVRRVYLPQFVIQ